MPAATPASPFMVMPKIFIFSAACENASDVACEDFTDDFASFERLRIFSRMASYARETSWAVELAFPLTSRKADTRPFISDAIADVGRAPRVFHAASMDAVISDAAFLALSSASPTDFAALTLATSPLELNSRMIWAVGAI